MMRYLKIAAHFLQHVAAWAGAWLLLLLIGLMAAVNFGALWLNTPQGGGWLAGQAAKLAAQSGYRLEIEEPRLSHLSRLHLESLTLADEQGILIEARSARLSINPYFLLMNAAGVQLFVNRLDVIRLPAAREKAEEQNDPKIFTLPPKPSAPLGKLHVWARINSLVLHNDVIDGGLSLKLDARHTLALSEDGPLLNGTVSLSDMAGALASLLPGSIAYDIAGKWESGDLSLSRAAIVRKGAYDISASGALDGGTSHITLDLQNRIEGGFHAIITEDITGRIVMQGTPDRFTGELTQDGALMDQPLSIAAKIGGTEETLNIDDLSGSAAGMSLKGALSLDRATWLADGSVSAQMDNMDLVRALSGMDTLSGSASLSLNASGADGTQSIDGEAIVRNLLAGTTRVDQARLTVTPEKGSNILHARITLDGFDRRAFSVNGNAAINPSEKSLSIETLRAAFGQGSLAMSGDASLTALNIKTILGDIHPDQLPFIALSDIPVTLPSGTLTLGGTPADPVLAVDLKALVQQDVPGPIALSLSGGYESGQASASMTGSGTGIRSLAAQARLPLSLSLHPFAFSLPPDSPLQGQIKGALDIAALSEAFMGRGQTLSGNTEFDMALDGTIEEPAISGSFLIGQGRFRDTINGIALNNIEGRGRFDRQTLHITSLSATDREDGRLSANGRIAFEDMRDPAIELDVSARNLHLLEQQQADARFNADIAIRQSGDSHLINGRISPEEIIINLPERFSETIPQLNIVKDGGGEPSDLLRRFLLDLDFIADNRIFVRGWGLDAEMAGRLNIGGSLETPDIRGTLESIRGRYEEFGKRFEIEKANLRFQGPIPPSPYLDVAATTNAGDIEATIAISGPATHPALSFSSSPGLPEEEILSRILFGRDASKISPFQAFQLTQTLRRFSGKGGGGFDPLGTIRETIGLDDIRIDGMDGDNPTVGAGKYITDRVYLEVEQGAKENSSATKVKIELTPSITLESKASAQGETGGGIFWEYDY